MSDLCVWELMVPTVRPNSDKFFTTRYHRVWDAKVRDITGGLTIHPPSTGQWVSPSGELFTERMIPVRIAATEEQIHKIIDMTLKYYDQEAVFCYLLSSRVIIKHRPAQSG